MPKNKHKLYCSKCDGWLFANEAKNIDVERPFSSRGDMEWEFDVECPDCKRQDLYYFPDPKAKKRWFRLCKKLKRGTKNGEEL